MSIPLGLDFPTEWGRREPAQLARRVILSGVVSPTMRTLTSLDVLGVENFERPGPFLIAANHQSHLDTPVLLSALPVRVRQKTVVAAAMDTFFMSPTKAATTVLAFNAFPVERNKVNRRSAALAQQLIEQGWNVLIYPEGGRTTDGRLMEFKPGVAYLAEKTGATVIPTYIHGIGELIGRRYAKAPLFTNAPVQIRHHVSVTFGEGLALEDGENIRRLNDRIESAVIELGRRVSGDRDYGRRDLD
jgi:1-acyl-sn-glycerol-3-phosphate acyltransferase